MGCGCTGTAAPLDVRVATLDRLWPEDLPFPPWAPYLGAVGARGQVRRAVLRGEPDDTLDVAMLAFLGDVLDGLSDAPEPGVDPGGFPDADGWTPGEGLCEPAYADPVDRVDAILANASKDLSTTAEGMDTYHDERVTLPEDCDWVFEGYALRLLEPTGASAWYTAGTWSSNLGYHVRTTSTSTVYLREYGLWRMYMPSPVLVADADESLILDAFSNPCGTGSSAEPTYSPDMFTGGRFSQEYVAFVDSPDTGRHFPVFAPEVEPSSTGWTVSDARAAGWSVTTIPTQPVAVPDGQTGERVKYQDITVLDLKEEIGYYLMIAVECRTTNAVAGDFCTSSADGCVGTWTDLRHPMSPETPYSHPYTRVVLFACRCADFRSQPVIGAPGRTTEAIVLLAPDRGSLTAGAKVCPNEYYGVPHAILTEDRSQILLYVPWTGYGLEPDYVPERVRTRYPADELNYRLLADQYGTPLWEDGISGYSCFAIPVSYVETVITNLATFGDNPDISDYLHRWFQRWVSHDAYQGEVLITDGTERTYDSPWSVPGGVSAQVPNSVRDGTDPHWVWINGELWVYWAKSSASTDRVTEIRNDQLYRAKLVDKAALSTPGLGFEWALGPNGDYTTFLTESTCDLTLDMRAVVEDPATAPADWRFFGRLLADPDVIQLGDGCLRASFFGGIDYAYRAYAPLAGNGLLVAITAGPVAESAAVLGGQP